MHQEAHRVISANSDRKKTLEDLEVEKSPPETG